MCAITWLTHFLDTFMTKKTNDFDLWTAFTKLFDKPKLSKNVPPIATPEKSLDAPDWVVFTNHMDWLNQHGNTYVPKVTPVSLKQKKQLISTYHPQMFLSSTTEASILELDRIDRKQLPKLTSHHMSVIDLHGYTLPQGYERLKAAFSQAIQRKSRILKVITGKGRPNPEPESPTLKVIFPNWMQEPFFSNKTIKIRKASPEHGGDGAFLIYLKQFK
jgi:DNA-nicking Smr family endonuclease